MPHPHPHPHLQQLAHHLEEQVCGRVWVGVGVGVGGGMQRWCREVWRNRQQAWGGGGRLQRWLEKWYRMH